MVNEGKTTLIGDSLKEKNRKQRDKLRNVLLEFTEEGDDLSNEELIEQVLSKGIDDVIKIGDTDVKPIEYALQFSQNISYSRGIVKAATQLGEYHRIKDRLEKSLECLDVAMKHNIPTDKSMGVLIYKEFGSNHFQKGQFEKALKYYYKALDINKEIGGNREMGAIYNNIGVVYKSKGEYEKALLYYFKSLKIKKDNNETRGLANSYWNIGYVFALQEEYENALKYYQKILKLPADTQAIKIRVMVHSALGGVRARMGDFENAIEEIRYAIEGHQKIGDEIGAGHCYMELGSVYQLKSDYETAAVSFQKALDIIESWGAEGDIARVLYLMGKLNYEIEAYDEAEQQLTKSYQSFEKLGIKAKQATSSELLADVYHNINKPSIAYEYMKHHSRLQKELATEEKTRLLAEMETRLKLQQRDSTIENLKIKQELLLNANQELELFAGRAAHDLKEPLRMMGSFSSILQRRYSDKLDDSGQKFLQYICDGANRMDRLLSDMLVYAKSGADPSQSVEVNLNDIFEVVKSNLRFTTIEKKATIEVDELPMVKAVSVAMIQLFQNIIANALKFTKPDVRPKIQIKSTPYDEYFHQVSISDNGIGIRKEKQEVVFVILERAHEKENYEGTGIGLATCKKIVESLGGKIWLESTEGSGTTFFFLLPKF